MLLRYILAILLSMSFTSGNSQTASTTSDDSVLFKMSDKAFALSFKNSDSAMLLANEALRQATLVKNERAIANAWNAMGWTMMHKGHLDTSIIYLQKAWQQFSDAKSENDIIRVCINISEVYTKQNKISDAIKFLMQADSLCIKTGNLPFHTNVKRQLAIVYRESGDYKKASDYFNQALIGFDKLGKHFLYINTGVSLSILYRNMKLLDSSLSILNRCLVATKQKVDMPYQVAMVEEHLAETYFDMALYKDALKHYTIAYNVFEKLNNRADLAYESFSLGKTLIKLNRFPDAEKYLLKSYALNDTLKMLNYQRDASQELASLYKKTGNWQKAFEYLQKASALKDSLSLEEQISKTNELKEKFETEKKETEISLLKVRGLAAEANNRRTRLLQYIFILLFAASIIIGWLLINRARMKRKLEKQILRNQIAGDLHDDIGSALSSIDISSRIALVKNEDRSAVSEQLMKIQQHARKTMDSISDIVWSINPQNDNFESVLMRMREFAAGVCEALQVNLQFSASEEVENISMDTDKRKNLFLIYKEAVNNAAKYSGCTLLTVEIKKTQKEQLIIKIADDGKGFDEETVKKGNGLRNMKTRAGHLKAELIIHSSPGQGTSIILSCPV